MLPLPQCCTSPAHEEATFPLSLSPSPWLLPLRSPLPSLSLSPTPSPPPLPIAVAVAVGHCRCGCRQPLPPLPLLRCCQPLLLSSPLPSAITISVTVVHCSCHLHQASPLLSPSAISESCCLGAARIVFDQLKQRTLNLFYFVWTEGPYFILFGQWAVH